MKGPSQLFVAATVKQGDYSPMATSTSLNFVQELYVAYYGRPADSAGLQYWAERADEEGQGAIVNAFGESQEYQDSYGDLTNEELVNNLYQQLFSRDADDAGLEYYVGVLSAGEKTLSEIALTISNAAQGSDSVVLNTKVQAANYYTNTVAASNYDVTTAKEILAGIDEVSTGADYDTAVDQIDAIQNVSGIAANYQAVVAAEGALATAQESLNDALEDLEESDIDYDGAATGNNNTTVEISDIQAFVTNAQNDLNSAVANDGTDAELDQEVADAKTAIRNVDGNFNADGTVAASAGGSLTAGDLLDNYEDAVAAVEADVEADGTTEDLATELNASLAAYLANNEDLDLDDSGTVDVTETTLDDLKTAVETYLASAQGDAEEATLLNAIADAQDDIFSGDNNASILEDVASSDSIESVVTTLDERNDLSDEATEAYNALDTAAGAEFLDLRDAQAAVETRADARAELAEAEGDLEAVTELDAAVTEAETAVEDAEEALGYTVEVLDAAVEAGQANAADLFVFDKESSIDSTVDLNADDAIFLGAGYAMGTDVDNGDDSQLEVFFENSGNNVTATIEVFADGGTSNVELTLTGVSTDDLSFNADNGTITVA